MSVRGWGGSVATAIGAAAGAGAAQLGLGYGLGIIAWLPAADGTSEAAWVASLAWAAWMAATSSVVGAICAQRISGSGPDTSEVGNSPAGPAPALATGLWRVALAVASAVGGLVTVVLVAVPARAATRADTFSPQTIAAGYAVIGVMIGLLVAIWALSSPAVARNVLATVCWLWLLAVIAVIDGVLSGRGLAGAQLGVWQITSDSERFWFRNYFYWPGAALSLGSALVIGALAARSAARRPAARVGAAISGMVGPLLAAAAYFLAAPRLVGIRAEQVSAHLMAPYAVVAGLAGSALVAVIAQRAEATAQRTEVGARRSEASGQPAEVAGQPADVAGQPAEAVGRLPRQSAGGSGPITDGSDQTPVADDGHPRARAAKTGTRTRTRTGTRTKADRAEPRTSDRPEETSDRLTGTTTGAGPAWPGESPTVDRLKSRLGRLGRRSR